MNLDELESAAPPAPAQAKSPRGEVVTDPQQLKAWRDAGALPPRGPARYNHKRARGSHSQLVTYYACGISVTPARRRLGVGTAARTKLVIVPYLRLGAVSGDPADYRCVTEVLLYYVVHAHMPHACTFTVELHIS